MNFTIRLLYFITFLDLLAVSLLIPLLPSHIIHLGGSHFSAGLLGSLYAGVQLGSGPLVGSLSDLKGRKVILIITLLCCAATYVIIGLTSSVFVILFMRTVLGIFKQTQMLSRALVTDYEKNKEIHSAIYGKMAAISGTGITIGPVIGGHIVEDFPENGMTILGALVGTLFFINAGLVTLLPDVAPKRKNSRTDEGCDTWQSKSLVFMATDSFKQSVIQLYNIKWSLYWDIFLLKALIGFAMSVYFSSYALYLKSMFHLTPKYIGYVISFQGIVGSISCYFMGYINSFYVSDTDFSLRNLHVFYMVTGSLLGIILSPNVVTYVLCLIPLAIGNAIARLVSLEMVLQRCHGEHRGTMIGAANSVRSLTGVIAPVTTGIVVQSTDISYVPFLSVFASFAGLFISFYNNRLKVKTS